MQKSIACAETVNTNQHYKVTLSFTLHLQPEARKRVAVDGRLGPPQPLPTTAMQRISMAMHRWATLPLPGLDKSMPRCRPFHSRQSFCGQKLLHTQPTVAVNMPLNGSLDRQEGREGLQATAVRRTDVTRHT